MIILVGTTALSAHYCMTRAFKLADATVVVPMDFLRLPLIMVVGCLLYQESVDWFVLAGALSSMPVYGGLAIIGAALSAIYLLSMYKRVALGPISNPKLNTLGDITIREFGAIAALLIFVFWIGLHPLPFLALMDASVDELLRQISPQTGTALTPSVITAPSLTDFRGG